MSASARIALVACAALAAACSNAWRRHMWYQPSVRPEQHPRPQPERSVPLGAGPRYVDRDDTTDLRNPVAPTPESLAHGKMLFVARCAPCHGPEGTVAGRCRGSSPRRPTSPTPP